MRRVSILLALLGLAVAAALVLRFDAGEVFRAIIGVGWRGAAILLAWQAALYVLLGLAWRTVQPGVATPVLIWGRMVRDAATACLPVSPVGGYVIGARALTLCDTPWTTAASGTVVDVTAEIGAQLLFALFGVSVLLVAQPGSGLIVPAAIGVGLALAALLAALRFRRAIGHVAHALTRRLFPDTERLGAELSLLYRRPARLALGTALHLSGWFATGIGTWISLRLLGHQTGLVGVLALEALLDAAVALAFAVPGAAGVQEAAYVGLGAIFGVPPDLALGVSLLRRAREIGWGLPILGLWQLQELRRL